MSRIQPVKYNNKEKQIQWINGLVHIHDYNCGCNNPLECTILQIHKQEPKLKFTKEEQKQLSSWLTDTTEDILDDVEFGDDVLENLFSTELGEEDIKKEDG